MAREAVIARGSHSFTCQPLTNHTCLYRRSPSVLVDAFSVLVDAFCAMFLCMCGTVVQARNYCLHQLSLVETRKKEFSSKALSIHCESALLSSRSLHQPVHQICVALGDVQYNVCLL